jgi:hypothetical protein
LAEVEPHNLRLPQCLVPGFHWSEVSVCRGSKTSRSKHMAFVEHASPHLDKMDKPRHGATAAPVQQLVATLLQRMKAGARFYNLQMPLSSVRMRVASRREGSVRGNNEDRKQGNPQDDGRSDRQRNTSIKRQDQSRPQKLLRPGSGLHTC